MQFQSFCSLIQQPGWVLNLSSVVILFTHPLNNPWPVFIIVLVWYLCFPYLLSNRRSAFLCKIFGNNVLLFSWHYLSSFWATTWPKNEMTTPKDNNMYEIIHIQQNNYRAPGFSRQLMERLKKLNFYCEPAQKPFYWRANLNTCDNAKSGISRSARIVNRLYGTWKFQLNIWTEAGWSVGDFFLIYIWCTKNLSL